MNINGEELLLLVIIAVIVIGPERLPKYAEQLGQLVRNVKKMATGATERIKEELGEEAEDLDLSQFDPRKYDPRRIVREALADEVMPNKRRPTSTAARNRSRTGSSTTKPATSRTTSKSSATATAAAGGAAAAAATANGVADGDVTEHTNGATDLAEHGEHENGQAAKPKRTLPSTNTRSSAARRSRSASGTWRKGKSSRHELVGSGAPFDDEAT